MTPLRPILFGAWIAGGLVAPAVADQGAPALVAVCAACHRLDGPQAGAPTITGWPADDLARKLRSFRHGEGDNHIMTTVSRTLSDDEISRVARYLGTIGNEAAHR